MQEERLALRAKPTHGSTVETTTWRHVQGTSKCTLACSFPVGTLTVVNAGLFAPTGRGAC